MTFNEFRGHFLTREEATVVTRCTSTTLTSHPDVLRLHGIHPGEELYPALQFGRDGAPTPGMGNLIRSLSEHLEEREIASFCTRPLRALGGRTPIDWLRAGGALEAVTRAAFAD